MEEDFLTEILKTTYTLESFKKRVMALKLRVEKSVFKSTGEKGGDDPLPVGQGTLGEAQDWADDFDEKILAKIDSDNFRQVFDWLDQFISESTPLAIYFVFIPDDAQVEEIGERLRKSLNKPKLIFSVKAEPSLIGGCAIAYKGVYKDYSLKAKISANKDKLVEEFRRYLKQ